MNQATVWAHLPNAALIDEVLAPLKTRPKKWAAYRDTTRDAAWHAAQDAIAALIAYDDAGQFMKLPAEHLQRLYRIDPHPMFLLLQPAAIVFTEQGDSVCLG